MKIIIIGGVAAGAKTAAKTKRMLPDSEVYIYTKDNYVSYSACGMPYYIAGDFQDTEPGTSFSAMVAPAFHRHGQISGSSESANKQRNQKRNKAPRPLKDRTALKVGPSCHLSLHDLVRLLHQDRNKAECDGHHH